MKPKLFSVRLLYIYIYIYPTRYLKIQLEYTFASCVPSNLSF